MTITYAIIYARQLIGTSNTISVSPEIKTITVEVPNIEKLAGINHIQAVLPVIILRDYYVNGYSS